MKNFLLSSLVLAFLLLLIHPSFGQLRRKKSAPPEKNEIETPKERLKSRSKGEVETRIKVKKRREFVEKKSKNNSSKTRVSRKSIETVVPVEDSKAFSQKKKKPLRQLKSSQKKADEIADSEGKVRTKRMGSDKTDISKEKTTLTVKKKSLKRQRKENEKQAKSISSSEGNVKVKRFGSDKVSISDENVTQKIKLKSRNRQRRLKENEAEKIADSDGPVKIKREPYRKRPGTVYEEDKKGGSRYKSKGETGAFTYKSISPEKKEKRIARKSQNNANYEGDIKLAKRNKELHPSSSYLDAKKKDSYEEKEKLRKKQLKKSRTRNGGQPKIVTEKRKKPKYNTRENKIWND